MKHIVYLFIAAVLSSCIGNREYKRIKFNHVSSTESVQKSVIYETKVPKGYELKVSKAGGEIGTSNEYWYKDSSIFYFSNFGASLNDDNIKNEGLASKKASYILINSNKDTLNLNGKTKQGLYWREINIGKMSFGYKNVSNQKKEIFDKIITSIKMK